MAVMVAFKKESVPESESNMSQNGSETAEPENELETESENVEETGAEESEDGAGAPETEQEAEKGRYMVSFGCLNHCSVLINGSAEETEVKAGEEVILTVEAKEGFMIDLVAAIDDSDTQIVLEKQNDASYRFIMPERVVIVSAVGKYALMLMASYGVGDYYTVTVSEVRYPETNPNGTQIVGEYIEFSNGAVGFCTQHLQTAPTVGAGFTVTSVCTNETIRKALYYGWNGPADLGIGYQTTHLGVSVANGYPDSAWKVGQKYLDQIASLATAPAEFKVYILSIGVSGVQEVAIWEYNPIQYIRIKKTFESGGNSYNPDVSAAVYAIFKDAACTQRYGTPYISGNPSAFRIEADNMSGVIPVEPGVYFVKEISAPSGYTLDTTVYKMDCSNKSYTSTSSPLMITSTDKVAKEYAKVVKTSSNTSITNGNDCYSLSGAVYGIYASRADAQNNRDVVAKLTTGSNGQSGTVELKPKTYCCGQAFL